MVLLVPLYIGIKLFVVLLVPLYIGIKLFVVLLVPLYIGIRFIYGVASTTLYRY